MEKIITTSLYAMMGISALLSILQIMGFTGEAMVISWCYLLVVIAAVAAIAFPMIRMVSDFQSAKNSLMGVGVLFVVFGLAYALASSEILPSFENYVKDAGKVKMIGGSIIAFYILAVGAIGSVIYSEVSSMLK